jgi:LysM repeat protein
MKRPTLFLFACFFATALCMAQYSDPAAAEDAAMARQKLLKAADQIDILANQINTLQQDMNKMHDQMVELKNENDAMKDRIKKNEEQQAKERDAIISEVAKTVAQTSDAKKDVKNEPTPQKEEKKETGYEFVVQKGDTLYTIAKAYREKGVKVSVDDIREANHLKPHTNLKVGQKLFIPDKKQSE